MIFAGVWGAAAFQVRPKINVWFFRGQGLGASDVFRADWSPRSITVLDVLWGSMAGLVGRVRGEKGLSTSTKGPGPIVLLEC